MSKIMLINAAQPEEIRVAVLKHDELDAFFVERKGKAQAAGNIYKGRAVNVEPSLQAVFVDLGTDRNGFLHASDVIPPDGGYPDLLAKPDRGGGPDPENGHRPGRFLTIEQMLSRGQEVLVQITKEGLGTKGAALTTYISLPGRYLVLMPGISRLGISKKIVDDEQRRRLKRLLAALRRPEGVGIILRTVSVDCTPEDIQRDLDNLLQLWSAIRTRAQATPAPGVIYQEGDLVIRAIRDTLSTDTREIVIDDEASFLRAEQFMRAVNPNGRARCRQYIGATPLFHKYGVEEKLGSLLERRIELPNGTSIVIEQTEAMVTIDINSGKFRHRRSNAATILHANLAAAQEIARQLRLRDIGGLIMVDFIDMESADHRQQVEQTLREALAADKARTHLCPISPLGVLEMTRQRIRPSLSGTLYTVCPHCGGSGHVRSRESIGLDFIRVLRAAIQTDHARRIRAELAPETALYVANKYRRALAEMEQESGIEVELAVNDALGPSEIRLYTTSETGKTTLFDA